MANTKPNPAPPLLPPFLLLHTIRQYRIYSAFTMYIFHYRHPLPPLNFLLLLSGRVRLEGGEKNQNL